MGRSASNLRALQLLLAFAGIIFAWPVLVGAQSLKMGISPDRFEFVAGAGETVRGHVEFTNGSNSPLSIHTEVIDFLPDGEDGKIAVDGVNYPLHSLAPWVLLRQSELTVGPLGSAPVDFEIRVPVEAAAGAHWGVLVFRTEGSYHLGAIILVNVRGAAPEKLSVASFDASHVDGASSVTFVARLRNEGGLYEKPQGTISVRNVFGGTVAEVALPAQNILPGFVRRATTSVAQGFWLGPYTATLRATYGADQKVTAMARFWVVPTSVWWGLGLITTLSVLGLLSARRRRLRN